MVSETLPAVVYDLKEEAKQKGYLIITKDCGPFIYPRYEIWLAGDYHGPYTNPSLLHDFHEKIGMGNTWENAAGRARLELEKYPSHAE